MVLDSGQLADKCRGALVGALVGDALGAPFEGFPRPVPAERIEQVERDTGPLSYTDDTAMTVALAESLLYVGGVDQDHLAAAFVAHWERDPDRGYGGGTAALLARVAAGEPWQTVASEQFGGQGSMGDGAAMRVAPVALHARADPVTTAVLARATAEVTHAHPVAIDAACAQAVAVATALAEPGWELFDPDRFLSAVRAVAEAPMLIEQFDRVAALMRTATAAEIAMQVGTGVMAQEAVPAALCAFLRHPDSFADAVRFAVGLGGDTDTIASMAGAVVGARLGEGAIPDAWLARTEGVARLRELADSFAARSDAGSGT